MTEPREIKFQFTSMHDGAARVLRVLDRLYWAPIPSNGPCSYAAELINYAQVCDTKYGPHSGYDAILDEPGAEDGRMLVLAFRAACERM